MADMLRAQAFRSGRAPDELTRRLETSYLELRAERGQDPKPGEVAEAAGGKWNELDGWWEFPFDDLQTPSHKALCRRIEAIRKSHKGG